MNAHHEDRVQGVADAQVARAELYTTLGQLQDRLNYAKRVDDATARLVERVEEERRDRPVVFVAGVVVAALAAGGAVWAVARGIAKRFG